MDYNLSILKEMSILFIEDDEIILKQLYESFKIFFKEVFTAKNNKDAFIIFEEEQPDFILSDIELDNESGLKFIQKVRKLNYQIPIIVISSYSTREYLLEAANLGIDGYMIKPLDMDEFFKVIFNSYSRITTVKKEITLLNNIQYNLLSKELYKDEEPIILGVKERKLLELFISNRGKTLDKKDISSYIWPLDSISDSAIKNLIGRLRTKIDSKVIITVKGGGWKLNIQ